MTHAVKFLTLIFFGLWHFINKNNTHLTKVTRATHEKKLNALEASLKAQKCDPDSVIFNFSSRLLTVREKFLLAFGIEFALPVHKPNFIKHFYPFEVLTDRLQHLHRLNDVPFSAICTNIKKTAFFVFSRVKRARYTLPQFQTSDINILRELSRDPSVILSLPDKGRGVVLLNREDYLQKMQLILSDESKFSPISNGDIYRLSLQHEDKINRFLRKLKNKGSLSIEQYNSFFLFWYRARWSLRPAKGP